MPDAIPEGFNTLTPTLVLTDASAAIDMYTKALGAKELYRMADPKTGKIMHACLQIGSSKLFMCDANPEMGCGTPSVSSFYVYMPEVDKAFAQAKQGGMEEKFAPQDMFWGDRTGTVRDRFGIMWTLATHVRDVAPDEMEEGRKKFAEKMQKAA